MDPNTLRRLMASLPEEVVRGRRLNVDPYGIPPALRGLMQPRTQPMMPSMDPASMPGQPPMGNPIQQLPGLPQQPGMPQPMQQAQQGLGFMDRLRNGIELPDKPTHYKHRGSQNFLRGLVHGFKGGAGTTTGGGSGGAPRGPDGLTAAERIRFQIMREGNDRQGELARSLMGHRDRGDDRADTKLPYETGYLSARTEDIPADNARMDRHYRTMEAQGNARIAILRQRMAEARANGGGSSSGSYAAQKAYREAEANVAEAEIVADYERKAAGMRPSSRQKKKLESERDVALQGVKSKLNGYIQEIARGEMSRKGTEPPSQFEGVETGNSSSLPDGLDEEDFD